MLQASPVDQASRLHLKNITSRCRNVCRNGLKLQLINALLSKAVKRLFIITFKNNLQTNKLSRVILRNLRNGVPITQLLRNHGKR